MRQGKIVLLLNSFLLLVGMGTRLTSQDTGQMLQKRKLKDWPQVEFGNIRLLIAQTPSLANQGFAGARPEEMESTLMIFPHLSGGIIFTNTDQGYGPVVKDLKIVYFDKDFRVLKSEVMKAYTGRSSAPEGTVYAVEGLVYRQR